MSSRLPEERMRWAAELAPLLTAVGVVVPVHAVVGARATAAAAEPPSVAVAASSPTAEPTGTSTPDQVPGIMCLRAPNWLRPAVESGARRADPPLRFRFVEDPGTAECDRRIDLDFTSSADRSRQMQNRSGAEALGPAGLLLGAVTPWKCRVAFKLTATVADRGGTLLGTYESIQQQDRVGTMLRCNAPSKPKPDLAEVLVTDVIRAARAAGVLEPAGPVATVPDERP